MNTDNADMWLLTPDLSEATEMADGALPPGVYKARVTGGKPGKGKTSGDPYISWELTVFGAEGEMARYNNWKAYKIMMLAGKAALFSKDFYKACTGQDLPAGKIDWRLLVGSEIQMTCKTGQPFNGEPAKYPEVSRIEQLSQH